MCGVWTCVSSVIFAHVLNLCQSSFCSRHSKHKLIIPWLWAVLSASVRLIYIWYSSRSHTCKSWNALIWTISTIRIVAERISGRQLIRDVFSRCAYVRANVSVTLRNTNRSRFRHANYFRIGSYCQGGTSARGKICACAFLVAYITGNLDCNSRIKA